MEKHRTEVTEVTEGNLGVVDERAWVKPLASLREHEWKGIAQRTRRSQRGKLGVMDERAWVNTAGFRPKTREWKSTHRGHGGRRGEIAGGG
jgi:hypothetical protein